MVEKTNRLNQKKGSFDAGVDSMPSDSPREDNYLGEFTGRQQRVEVMVIVAGQALVRRRHTA